MDPHPPRYDDIGPSVLMAGPTALNNPLQPQGFPLNQQTAIVPCMTEIPGIPLGLEYLTQIDQVVIREKFCSGQQLERNYELFNSLGQRIFLARQVGKYCCPVFNVHIMDNNNWEVIELLQSRSCSCTIEVEVHCPPGTIIGYSILNRSALATTFSIMNAARQIILVVVGPGLQTSIFGDVNFEVKTNDETQTVGMIRLDSGQISVHFPLDLDVKLKSVLIGTAYFLDTLIFGVRAYVTQPRRN